MDSKTGILIAEKLKDYINNDLKELFGFPNEYDIEISEYTGTYVLKRTGEYSRKNISFANMLRNNQNTFNNVKRLLLDFIRKFVNVRDIFMFPFNHDIKVELIFEPFPLENFPDVGIYANIASNLTLSKLNNLCKTNKQFVSICKTKQFWFNLLYQRFPEYNYAKVDNPEQLYKGLLYYQVMKTPEFFILSETYPVTFKFIVYYGIMTREYIEENIENIFDNSSIDIIDFIYKIYPDIFTDDFYNNSLSVVIQDNIKYPLSKYKWIKQKLNHQIHIEELINLLYGDDDELSSEILIDINNKLSPEQTINIFSELMINRKYTLLRLAYENMENKLSPETTTILLRNIISNLY